MTKKFYDSNKDGVMLQFLTSEVIDLVITSCFLYGGLHSKNPNAIPYVLGTQLATNIGSGIYEYVKHVKKKVRRRRGELLESN